jgi:8-oxo-dGTP diphosphatase
MERRVAVRAIIVHNAKLLAVKLKPNEAAIAGDFWCTIGGGVDVGEALIPALRREVIEETGITPVIGPLLYVQQFLSGDKEHLEFFFAVTNVKDFLNIDFAKSSHGLKEIAESSFILPSQEHILPAFLKDQDYTNLSSPTQFFSEL